MQNFIKISLISVALLSQLNADETTSIKDMFSDGEVSGQIRLGYYSNDSDAIANAQSVTAVGGQLKYETATLNGFSSGIAIYTSQNIDFLSGSSSSNKFSDFLTSSEKNYAELAEAYIDYAKNDFNIRLGRQVIDTPLADSDDVYMTPNTFEAVVASYELKDFGLTFMGANIQRMQGGDADYENVVKSSWLDTGDKSTNMLALIYMKNSIEASAWYYDIGKTTQAFYVEASKNMEIFTNQNVTFGVQYLDETEKNSSGVSGSIAGIMLETTYNDLTTMVAYNSTSVDSSKTIFEGFGGGCSYTNMQTTTAGTLDTDSSSFVISLGYDFSNINASVAYGKFKTDANGVLAEIDASVSYTFNDGEADLSFVYVNIEDKIVTNNNVNEIKIFANYNF